MPQPPYDEVAARLDELGAAMTVDYTHNKTTKGWRAIVTSQTDPKKTACVCGFGYVDCVESAVALYAKVHGVPTTTPELPPGEDLGDLNEGWA